MNQSRSFAHPASVRLPGLWPVQKVSGSTVSVSKDWFRLISVVLLLAVPVAGAAQTRFVTDSFEVTVRSGQGTSPSSFLRGGLASAT